MNVVIFGKGLAKSRQLSGAMLLSIGVVATLLLGAAGFGLGFAYSAHHGSGISIAEVDELRELIDAQKTDIQDIRVEKEDNLDALAINVARMNARMIRLDALGRRLTDMADIDDGEFDFDSEPAVGGPEEPLPHASGGVDLVDAMAAFNAQLDDREAKLEVLASVLAHRNLSDRVYPQGRPVNSGWISSYFGKRTDPFTGKPASHLGVDFAGKHGDEIIAVADGVVSWSADRYGFGLLVEVKHGNGYATRYAHNSKNLVDVGDEVKKGQTLALMGETGRATGPNLHFEVLKDGRRVNPVNFIRESSR